MEQFGHALPVMDPSDHLTEHRPNVDHLNLATPRLVLPLRKRIRHYQLLQRTLRHTLQRVPAQDPMRHDRVHLRRTPLRQVSCRQTQRTTRVRHVINQNRHLVLYVSHQHHPRD